MASPVTQNDSNAAASAGSSSDGVAAPSFVHTISPPHHKAIMYAARFDTPALMKAHPPIGWHREPNKNLIWKMIQNRTAKKEAEANEGSGKKTKQKQLRFAKYNSEAVQIEGANLLVNNTEFSVARGVYEYAPQSDPSVCEWFVNFADKHLFGFYASPLFAQDEWQCMEHPALCSLREYLEVKGKTESLAKPLTVTKFVNRGVQPTPCLVMNAPREVVIDAVGAQIYGNNFECASEKTIAAATKLIEPVTHSNIIAMEALKHGRGAYTTNQICIILQTAIAAFIGAKTETLTESKDVQSYVKQPKITMHSGNWGCGAFGGNLQLMCLLQVIAARVAGIDKYVHHAISDADDATCKKSMKDLEDILLELHKQAAEGSKSNTPHDKVPKLDQVAASIAAKGYRWGFSNGT